MDAGVQGQGRWGCAAECQLSVGDSAAVCALTSASPRARPPQHHVRCDAQIRPSLRLGAAVSQTAHEPAGRLRDRSAAPALRRTASARTRGMTITATSALSKRLRRTLLLEQVLIEQDETRRDGHPEQRHNARRDQARVRMTVQQHGSCFSFGGAGLASADARLCCRCAANDHPARRLFLTALRCCWNKRCCRRRWSAARAGACPQQTRCSRLRCTDARGQHTERTKNSPRHDYVCAGLY